MKRVFVTGSTEGIGLETARLIAEAGHEVVLHARNRDRERTVRASLPAAGDVLIGNLASLAETRMLAQAAIAAGPFDAVIHNAGISGSQSRKLTEDGLEEVFQVNVLAPYMLTALMPLPQRLIYLTSGLAENGVIELRDLQRETRPWDGYGAYADSKLCDLAIALAVARRHPQILSNAVCPGWVRSRMGGPNAPVDLRTGAATQVWLATSDDPSAQVTGRYFRHMNRLVPPQPATDETLQEGLLAACSRLSGALL
jgi:NAD(P)-dependent dehydrogenase (short-subunit alcohol dehydrogenase family)